MAAWRAPRVTSRGPCVCIAKPLRCRRFPTRVSALLELARDYSAASDYQRAVANCREALVVQLDVHGFHRTAEVQLALAEALLSQPRRTPAAVSEAATLAEDALRAATSRAEPGLEIAALRMLAQSHTPVRTSPALARSTSGQSISFQISQHDQQSGIAGIGGVPRTAGFRGYVDLLMRDVARRGPETACGRTRRRKTHCARSSGRARSTFDAARVSSLDATPRPASTSCSPRWRGSASAWPRWRTAVQTTRRTCIAPARHRKAARGSRRVACDGSTRCKGRRHFTDGGSHRGRRCPPDHATLLCARNGACISLGTRRTGIRATVLAATPAVIDHELTALAAAIRKRIPDSSMSYSLIYLPSCFRPARSVTTQKYWRSSPRGESGKFHSPA